MKTQNFTSLKLIAVVLLSSVEVHSDSLLFTQAKAQGCVANWYVASSGCTVQFTDLSLAKVNSTAMWYWNFGDGNTSTQQNPKYTYAASGIYTVCFAIAVKDSGGMCYDTLCKNITVTCPATGIAASSHLDLSLSVTNPVSSSAYVHYTIPSSGRMELALFDIVGNKIGILEDVFRQSAGMYSYSLNTGSYSKGIYFIRLDFEGTTPPEDGFVLLANITKKIIIVR